MVVVVVVAMPRSVCPPSPEPTPLGPSLLLPPLLPAVLPPDFLDYSTIGPALTLSPPPTAPDAVSVMFAAVSDLLTAGRFLGDGLLGTVVRVERKRRPSF